jgi:hypothetical protein
LEFLLVEDSLEVNLVIFGYEIRIRIADVAQVMKTAHHDLRKNLSVIHVWLIAVFLHEKASDTVRKALERMLPVDQSNIEREILF